jgi:hypothetical protein
MTRTRLAGLSKGGLLALAMAILLAACGGDPAPRQVDWTPRERAPQAAQHWWWEPVERSCQEDSDCRAGEVCQRVRLGTCPTCPTSGGGYVRGQDARICVDRDDARASGR